jgi:hypothetical protein
VLELFSMSEDDRHSVDGGGHSQRDSLFSSPEPEGSAIDSDMGVSSAADKRGRAGTSSHFLNYNRTGQEADRGMDSRLLPLMWLLVS